MDIRLCHNAQVLIIIGPGHMHWPSARTSFKLLLEDYGHIVNNFLFWVTRCDHDAILIRKHEP